MGEMDTVFSENMSLMQDLHSTFNLQPTITKVTNDAISTIKHEAKSFSTTSVADLKRESATIQREFTSQLELDTTFIDSRDRIITDIVTKTTQVKKDITEATQLVITNTTNGVKSLQDIKTNASIDINTHKETIIQEIHDIRDRVTTQIAVFQDDLQASTIVKM